jgi:hypothetical protein
MTNQGVNFHLPPGGQISAAVDISSLAYGESDPAEDVSHILTGLRKTSA